MYNWSWYDVDITLLLHLISRNLLKGGKMQFWCWNWEGVLVCTETPSLLSKKGIYLCLEGGCNPGEALLCICDIHLSNNQPQNLKRNSHFWDSKTLPNYKICCCKKISYNSFTVGPLADTLMIQTGSMWIQGKGERCRCWQNQQRKRGQTA